MATLPEIRQTALASSTLVNTTTVANINDESDATYIESQTGNGVDGQWRYSLNDTPSDFLSMDTYTITLRSYITATGDDTWQIRAFIADSSGTAVSSIPTYQTVSSVTVQDFTFTPTMPSTNTKAAWDDYHIIIDYRNIKNMAADGNFIRVTRSGITGTYTATPVTVSLSASATASTVGTGVAGGVSALSATATQTTAATRAALGAATPSGVATITTVAIAYLEQWWNGTTWVGTETDVASSVSQIDFAGTDWDNETYAWTVATNDGVLWGNYATEFTVTTETSVVVNGDAALSGTAAQTASATATTSATSALIATATTTATATATVGANASITSTGSQLIVGFAEKFGTTSQIATATVTINIPPDTTLLTPTDGATVNSSQTLLFDWSVSDIDGDTPAGYRFRRKYFV